MKYHNFFAEEVFNNKKIQLYQKLWQGLTLKLRLEKIERIIRFI